MLIAAGGCVRRRLWVRSEPAGARVFVDGVALGRTPLEVPFAFYGEREVRSRAQGYAPADLVVRLDAPWYAWPGLDLLAEVVLPWTVHDDRLLEVHMTPVDTAAAPRAQRLAERAQRRRRRHRAKRGRGAPAPSAEGK